MTHLVIVSEVKSTEDQTLVFGIEDCQPLGRVVGEGIAFEHRRTVLFADPTGAIGAVHVLASRGQHASLVLVDLQLSADPVDMGLFLGDLSFHNARISGRSAVFGQSRPSRESASDSVSRG